MSLVSFLCIDAESKEKKKLKWLLRDQELFYIISATHVKMAPKAVKSGQAVKGLSCNYVEEMFGGVVKSTYCS